MSDTQAHAYANKNNASPAEMPVIAQNQVRALQEDLILAGVLNKHSANGKYDPQTNEAVIHVARGLGITDIRTIDFTNQSDPEAQRFMHDLQGRAFVNGAKDARGSNGL